jgi:uncharacterized membrane protein YczE
MKNNKQFILRFCGMLIGVLLLGLGESLLIYTGWGVDPLGALSLSVSHLSGLPYGTCMLMENIVLLAFELILARKLIGIGTLCNMVLIGYVAGFFSEQWSRLPFLTGQSLAARVTALVVGLAVFTVAAAMYMAAGLGIGAYDWFPIWLARRTKKPSLRLIRILWDGAFALLALIFGRGLGIGVVTLGVVLALGPVIESLGNWLTARVYATENLG